MTLNEAAKHAAVAELLVHKRQAKKFYKKLQDIVGLRKTRSDVTGICFDFMQNLPMVFISVQEMCYLRKLYMFNIFEIANDRAFSKLMAHIKTKT